MHNKLSSTIEIINYLAHWERVNGTLCAIMPNEYDKFFRGFSDILCKFPPVVAQNELTQCLKETNISAPYTAKG